MASQSVNIPYTRRLVWHLLSDMGNGNTSITKVLEAITILEVASGDETLALREGS